MTDTKTMPAPVKPWMLTNLMANGVKAARDEGLTKDYDVAVSVKVALEDAGYTVVRMNPKAWAKRAEKARLAELARKARGL